MKKYILALFIVAAATGATAATGTQSQFAATDHGIALAQAVPAPAETTTVQTSAPVTSTTVVKGGDLAASFIEWLKVGFGTAIGGAVLWALSWVMKLMGLKATDMQKAQLQAIIVNGLNAAATKAQVSLRSTDKLDFSSKSAIVNDAVQYAQGHAAETIKALGLDPKSGEAVEAIRARIETALNDPNTPTPPAITPATSATKAA